MDAQRLRRVEELIQREIALLLQMQIKDPRVQNVNVSAVKVNRDCSIAKVYYTILNQQDEDQQTMQGLRKASGFMRRKLAESLSLRTTPRLDFYYDNSIQRGAYMENLIDKVVSSDKPDEQA